MVACLINDRRPSVGYLYKHGISLILRIVPNPDFGAGSVPERVPLLFIVEQLGRFEIHAVQGVQIKNDFTVAGGFGVDDSPVGDPAVRQKVLTAFRENISLLFTFE
jgi:hypothetical protein